MNPSFIFYIGLTQVCGTSVMYRYRQHLPKATFNVLTFTDKDKEINRSNIFL